MLFLPSTVQAIFSWPCMIALLPCVILGLAVHRRFYHPLAKIPGPFLPAFTHLYQWYYNTRYFKKIAELHEIYGPVVRISPCEIHLSDPDNYDKIYHVGSRFWKSPDFYGAFGVPGSAFATPSNDVHRHKRARLNPMFSRKSVLQLEHVVQDKVYKLIERVNAGIAANQPVDLHHAFRSVSIDVITDYAFDNCFNFLEAADFGVSFFTITRGVGSNTWMLQQFPLLRHAVHKVPLWLSPFLPESLGQLTKMHMKSMEQVEHVKARMASGKLDSSRTTIFSELMSPKSSNGQPTPTKNELKDECFSILGAAADTVGNALTLACYHILANRDVYASLTDELVAAFPNSSQKLDFIALERLPYLTAVIKEGLRLSFGVPGRLPRVTPEGGATFNGYYVPEGTIVGMSSWLMHRNGDAFPDPMNFDPPRWLDQEEARRLDHYMIPFSKGSRKCVGMPLAYCELYVTLGAFFRHFSNMELRVYKTTEHDLEYVDYFGSQHVRGRNWLKVARN